MKAFEKINEAVEASISEGCNWWEEFSSKDEAARVLKQAMAQNVEDWEMIIFLELFEEDSLTSQMELEEAINKHLNELKDSLETE